MDKEWYEVIIRNTDTDLRWSMKWKTSSFALAEALTISEGFPKPYEEIIAITKDYDADS
jgi:hypothetical protein